MAHVEEIFHTKRSSLNQTKGKVTQKTFVDQKENIQLRIISLFLSATTENIEEFNIVGELLLIHTRDPVEESFHTYLQ